jgi:hypothetical protein
MGGGSHLSREEKSKDPKPGQDHIPPRLPTLRLDREPAECHGSFEVSREQMFLVGLSSP